MNVQRDIVFFRRSCQPSKMIVVRIVGTSHDGLQVCRSLVMCLQRQLVAISVAGALMAQGSNGQGTESDVGGNVERQWISHS